MQDKELLQKQVCEQLKQITQLRSQVNELTLSTASQSVTDVEQRSAGVEHLQLRVDELNGALQVRDREVRWPPLLLCLFSLCQIHVQQKCRIRQRIESHIYMQLIVQPYVENAIFHCRLW